MPRLQPAAFALGGALVSSALAAVACGHSHDRASGPTADATDETAPGAPIDAGLGGDGDGVAATARRHQAPSRIPEPTAQRA
jgi:hypothetical protein